MDTKFIFTHPPKTPLSLELSVNMADKSVSSMFEYLKGLYITGLSLLECPDNPLKILL